MTCSPKLKDNSPGTMLQKALSRFLSIWSLSPNFSLRMGSSPLSLTMKLSTLMSASLRASSSVNALRRSAAIRLPEVSWAWRTSRRHFFRGAGAESWSRLPRESEPSSLKGPRMLKENLDFTFHFNVSVFSPFLDLLDLLDLGDFGDL